MRTKFKAWAEPFINEHPEYSLTDLEISKLDDFYLEIGSGKGGFLLNMALHHPECTFIGVEKNVTCAGITTKKLVENEISNAKLLFKDGQEVVKLIRDKSVKILFLNFSDPWPKKRHYKRRLTSDNFLNDYRRILKDDGEIRLKTDNDDLFQYSIEQFSNANFQVVKIEEDYQNIDSFDEITEYEKSFRDKGQAIHRLIIKK